MMFFKNGVMFVYSWHSTTFSSVTQNKGQMPTLPWAFGHWIPSIEVCDEFEF
jgi:hypothetical protein